MDLLYPLTYTVDGGIALTETDNERLNSRVKHLLDTIVGERRLYPQFGVPIDLLFNAVVPELATERMRIALSQLMGVQARVTLEKADESTITLRVEVGTQLIEATLEL
ncbi:MAG: hypothetical protein ACREPR_21750 [Brasilonema sp.]